MKAYKVVYNKYDLLKNEIGKEVNFGYFANKIQAINMRDCIEETHNPYSYRELRMEECEVDENTTQVF